MDQKINGVGRTREYTSNAERQQAYRERKRQEQERVQMALALLDEVESDAQALFVTLQKRGGHVEIHQRIKWASVYQKGNSFTVDWYAARHLIRAGMLVKHSSDFLRARYVLGS